MIAAPGSSDLDHEVAATSLRTFMQLPTLQRSAVILKDVLGHSLEEVASITGASEAAAKSALQRGRARLREIAREPADISLPILSDAIRARLIRYVEGFKTGDFDGSAHAGRDDISGSDADISSTPFGLLDLGALFVEQALKYGDRLESEDESG